MFFQAESHLERGIFERKQCVCVSEMLRCVSVERLSYGRNVRPPPPGPTSIEKNRKSVFNASVPALASPPPRGKAFHKKKWEASLSACDGGPTPPLYE